MVVIGQNSSGQVVPLSAISGQYHTLEVCFFFSSRRRHTRSVSAFLLNRSSDLNSRFPRLCAKCFLKLKRLVIGKILTSRLSLSKHLAHNLGNLLLLGKIGVFHNRRNASSRLLLLISKHLILCIYLDRKSVV